MKERGMIMRKGSAMRALLERWLSLKKARGREPPPEGCLAVYVGAERERFVIRTECVNHRLFRALLDEAEEVNGYAADGPLELPCDAEEFTRVVEAIEREMAEEETTVVIIRCGGSGIVVRGGHSAAVHGRQVAVG